MNYNDSLFSEYPDFNGKTSEFCCHFAGKMGFEGRGISGTRT
jgi:hypothetical protein